MKRKITSAIFASIISLIFFSFSATAQEEVLFGGKLVNGGYGGPTISFGQFNDEMGLFVGGRGGWIINHTFSVGAGGWGLVSNNRVKDYSQVVHFWGYDSLGRWDEIDKIDSSWYITDMGYGGIILEYIYNSHKIVHLTGSLLIGAGSMAYNNEPNTQRNNNMMYEYNDNVSFDRKRSDFFVLEPALNAEFNIASWFRINTGVSYRFVTSLDMPKTTNSQISGLSGNIILKFGRF
jgi:hypothetical protein